MRRGLCQARPATWLLTALIGAVPVAGQEGGSTDSYLRAEQVSELNQYVENLRPGPTLEDLITLSTLLAEPADRVTWLLGRIKGLLRAADRQDDAERLCKLTRDHVPQWEQRAAEVATLLERLDELCREKSVPMREITDPEALRKRVAEERPKPNRGELGNLPNVDQFVLLARGVPPEALGLSDELAGAPAWDVPRRVLLNLADRDDGALPPMWELLDLEHELRTKRADAANDTVPGAPDAFRIAAALLGRAMGVDGLDRGVTDDDLPESWGTLAEGLEDEDTQLWQWAAAARLLQAASTADAPGGAEAVKKKAADQLEKAKVVGETDSRFVVTLEAWLERVGQSAQEGHLPLNHDFAARARSRRQQAERQFVTAWQSGNPDGVFRWMQLAKSRELGLGDDEIEPLTVEDAKNTLILRRARPPLLVHLFLEVLEVNLTGEMSRHNGLYGLVLCSNTGSLSDVADLVPRLIDRKQTLDEVLREAVGHLQSPPDGGNPVRQARMFYAPDGSGRTRGREVLQAEEGLWERVGSDLNTSWLLHLPSAASLRDKDSWILERVLRLWYLSQLRYAAPSERPPVGTAPILDVLRKGRTREPRELRSRVLAGITSVYVLSTDSSYTNRKIRNVLADVMTAKKNGQLPKVMAVTVSENNPGR